MSGKVWVRNWLKEKEGKKSRRSFTVTACTMTEEVSKRKKKGSVNIGSLRLLNPRGSLILTVPSQSHDLGMSKPWIGEQCACLDKSMSCLNLLLSSQHTPTWQLSFMPPTPLSTMAFYSILTLTHSTEANAKKAQICSEGPWDYSWSGVCWRHGDPWWQWQLGGREGDVDYIMR